MKGWPPPSPRSASSFPVGLTRFDGLIMITLSVKAGQPSCL